jgi:16S rRNA pseudouridine516 synthase
MEKERLDKILAHHGFGTRKDVKRLCHKRVVYLNGNLVTDPAAKVDVDTDTLEIEGEKIALQRDLYVMLNKCRDVVCANKDGEHQTVFDLLDESLRHKFLGGDLHCMGRLDIDTEGLLILTTDGKLTHSLLSPKTHVPKTYAVGLRDSLTNEEKQKYVEIFQKGFWIDREQNEDGFDCAPAFLVWRENNQDKRLEQCAAGNSSGKTDCFLTIYEGKFHQVKRMFAQQGNEVVYLKRVKMGSLYLDSSLELGTYRELTDAEIEELAER